MARDAWRVARELVAVDYLAELVAELPAVDYQVAELVAVDYQVAELAGNYPAITRPSITRWPARTLNPAELAQGPRSLARGPWPALPGRRAESRRAFQRK